MSLSCNHLGHTINPDTEVNVALLSDLISCQDCQIQTPKIRSRLIGMALALAETICWTVLRPFAFLLSLPLYEDWIIRRKTLIKCARILTYPRNKSKMCFQQFLGYMEWNSQGKTKIIYAQRNKFLLQRYVFAKNWNSEPELQQLSALFECKKSGHTATKHKGLSFYSEEGMNWDRLTTLRWFNFLDNARSFTFASLLKDGYLFSAVAIEG